jgi:hypothetical protein
MGVNGFVTELMPQSNMDAIGMRLRIGVESVNFTIRAAIDIGIGPCPEINPFMTRETPFSVDVWIGAELLRDHGVVRRPYEVKRSLLETISVLLLDSCVQDALKAVRLIDLDRI